MTDELVDCIYTVVCLLAWGLLCLVVLGRLLFSFL